MELNKIILHNFRQYYGENTIDFATGNKNITLILGENNAGKTGIYRGLMFALYGDKVLGQDSGKNADIKLVNMKYLEDIGKLGEGSVSVHFTVDNQKYILTRSIKAIILNDEYNQHTDDTVSLDTIKDGEYLKDIITGKDSIQHFINNVLDSNIKEFFFFDGEHIKTLASSNKDSRHEVKKGIIKLMDIDKFEKTKKIIDSLVLKEEKIVSKKAENTKIEELTNKKENILNQIKSKELEKNTIFENMDSMNSEISRLESELEKNQNLNKIYSLRKEKRKELGNLDNSIDDKKNILISYHFKQVPYILLSDNLNKLKYKLKENLSDSTDNIPIHLIEKALETKKCQCCNQDIITDEAIYYLEKLKENFAPKKTTNISNTITTEISRNIKDEKNNIFKIKELLLDIEKKESLKKDLNIKITNLSSQIDSESESETTLNAKNTKLNKLIKDKNQYNYKTNLLEEDIKNLNSQLKEIERTLDKHLKLNKDLDYEIKRLDFLKSLKNTIDEKYNHYIELTRENLGKETTLIFNELIDYKDRTLVEKIEIDNNYSMKILYSNGINVTEDISQGQQLIVALSFVTALAKMASKSDSIIDFPLFMDTPFAKLSRENRKSLICSIPNLTRQWIPLFTDTEFTEFEKDIFDSNEKVGKNYLIRKETDKISSIDIKGEF